MSNNNVVIATVDRPSRFIKGMGNQPNMDTIVQYFKSIQMAIRQGGVLIGPVEHLLLHCDKYIGEPGNRELIGQTYVHLGEKVGYHAFCNHPGPSTEDDLEIGIQFYISAQETGKLQGKADYLLAVTSGRLVDRVARAFQTHDYQIRRRP